MSVSPVPLKSVLYKERLIVHIRRLFTYLLGYYSHISTLADVQEKVQVGFLSFIRH